MIRWKNVKYSLTLFAVCTVLFWINAAFVSTPDDDFRIAVPHSESLPQKECLPAAATHRDGYLATVKEQACTANNGREMRCLRDDSDVYFPFSFIKKQFDVSGKMGKDGNRFEWFTSYSRVRVPDGSHYDPKGAFGHFATYNVENRDRVRCISGETGVPMSTQWRPDPYYYPIQIAQYGLQHYSRMKSVNESDYRELVFGTISKEWKGSAGMHESSERTFFKDEQMGAVVNISAGGKLSNAGCYVYLDKDPQLHVVSFKWKPMANASFTILVKHLETSMLLLLNYVTDSDNRCVWNDTVPVGDQLSFSYSLGELSGDEWHSVTRDALIDAARAMTSFNLAASTTNKKKDTNVIFHPGDIKIITIGFRGQVTVQQRIIQSTSAHREFFAKAADWMLEHQDEKGGWPVPVERSIADRKLVLPAGWYSAMAQGHAFSLLVRAYWELKDKKYLSSAVKGLSLFEKAPSAGGVRNELFGRAWYEEYPTTPGSFVLNGFMYALIGLYDLSSATVYAEDDASLREGVDRARKLFDVGMSSLRELLPLYDTGSGSTYDMRHVALHTAPNLARWDYHAVHVYLLKWLVQITNDASLDETADRWIAYSYGKRAKHN